MRLRRRGRGKESSRHRASADVDTGNSTCNAGDTVGARDVGSIRLRRRDPLRTKPPRLSRREGCKRLGSKTCLTNRHELNF